MNRLLQKLCLWLIWNDNIMLGKLAPWILGIGLGRRPHKIKREYLNTQIGGQR